MDWNTVLYFAVSSKSPLLIPNLLLKNIRVCIRDFEILRVGPHKIIKLMEKDKLKPRPDLTKKDQLLSLLENIDHFVNSKVLKKKPIFNFKPVIKPIPIKKPLL